MTAPDTDGRPQPTSLIGTALPGRYIDLIRDGVPTSALRAKGGRRAIWSALLGICQSAQIRGHSQIDVQALLEEKNNKLWWQMHTHKGRPLPEKQVRAMFDRAWDRAWELRTQNPTQTPEEVAADAAARAEQAINAAADAADERLNLSDRDVLAFAAREAVRRGMTRVTLPLRAVQAETGRGQTAVQNALVRLVKQGHLIKVSAGRGGGSVGTRRAAVYELRPILRPVNGSMRPPKPSGTYLCGPPEKPLSDGEHLSMRPPQPELRPPTQTTTQDPALTAELTAETATQEDEALTATVSPTVNITPAEWDLLLRLRAEAAKAQPGAPEAFEPDPGVVVPFRPRTGATG